MGDGTTGAELFARYAHPPNELGYCGPEDFTAAANGAEPREVAQRARSFDGAWPYLELIATAASIPDPLDSRVVEAYWLGSPLLDGVPAELFADTVDRNFRDRPGLGPIEDDVAPAGPHHSFHVFVVYPWAAMIAGPASATALNVLDRCRIRWGHVQAVSGDEAQVRSRPLRWDGSSLSLDAPAVETVRWAAWEWSPLRDLRPGELVSLHWGWVCDRLTAAQGAQLRRRSVAQLAFTNRRAPWAAASRASR